ncbi:MAG: DUF2953 domain-containing protein [Clostridia bacterium]|nr:DUF2953 domain-containing protein [Clostridia bacterium]
MTALWIILGIIAFFVFVFSVKVTVYMTYDEDFKLDVRWLFIKLPILPKKEKPEKEKKPKKEKPKKEEKPKEEEKTADPNAPMKDNIIKAFYNNQGFSGVLQLLRDTVSSINGMFGSIFRHFVFKELKLYLTVGGSDAAETALLYGKICSAVFPAMGLITSTCKVKEYDCAVRPNFIAAEKTAVFRAVISYRPIFATNAVVVMAFRMLFKVVFKLLKNKPKAEAVQADAKNQNVNNIKEDIKQ